MHEHLGTDTDVMRWLGIRSRHTLRKLVEQTTARGTEPPFVVINNARRWVVDRDVLWGWLRELQAAASASAADAEPPPGC